MTSSYDSETVTLLRAILEDAWERLTFEQRARTQKSEVALRILRLVRQGEQLALLGTNSRRPLPLGGLRVTALSANRIKIELIERAPIPTSARIGTICALIMARTRPNGAARKKLAGCCIWTLRGSGCRCQFARSRNGRPRALQSRIRSQVSLGAAPAKKLLPFWSAAWRVRRA
jgi:hypothetical protein